VRTTQKPRIDAAVLVPLYRDGQGEIQLVLIRRSQGGIHGGQLAFPGGKRDAGDPSMLAAALREVREEIGIGAERIDVLADLPVAETRSSGYLIYPFLARIVPPGAWRRNEREIAEIIAVRLADLARPEARGEALEQPPGGSEARRIPFLRVGTHRLWGASYRILHPLVPRLLAGEWTI
jgi:8-oxo-dGTP pyrophosphatase MutT (NUDIX family)